MVEDKYLFSYVVTNTLLVADSLVGMVLEDIRPDIAKKLVFAGVILAIGSVLSVVKYFRTWNNDIKSSKNVKQKSNDNLKISKELNKLLDGIVRTSAYE
ncbi:hypothetical protein HDR59_04300 [bacterium]|nr:hypothetical protein [bacterium]